MRLKRRHKSRLDPEGIRLPLIALIDVVLFLLFYFMIAGSLAPPEGELSAALGTRAGGQASGSRVLPQHLKVMLGAGGPEYRVGDRVLKDRNVLASVMARLSKDAGIIIQADPRVSVEATAIAIQVARDAGFDKISYLPG